MPGKQLKDCKFCGDKGELAMITTEQFTHIHCVKCGQFVERRWLMVAVAAWNKAQTKLRAVK